MKYKYEISTKQYNYIKYICSLGSKVAVQNLWRNVGMAKFGSIGGVYRNITSAIEVLELKKYIPQRLNVKEYTESIYEHRNLVMQRLRVTKKKNTVQVKKKNADLTQTGTTLFGRTTRGSTQQVHPTWRNVTANRIRFRRYDRQAQVVVEPIREYAPISREEDIMRGISERHRQALRESRERADREAQERLRDIWEEAYQPISELWINANPSQTTAEQQGEGTNAQL